MTVSTATAGRCRLRGLACCLDPHASSGLCRTRMAEMSNKSINLRSTKAHKMAPSFGNMTSLATIESEYIKNLQKQVYLLELETSFLKGRAQKATSVQPKITSEAEKMLKTMKELQSAINHVQVELGAKESSTEILKAENEALQRHRQSLSDTSAKEKMMLMEDVTKHKQLAEISTLDITHKQAELIKIQQDLQRTVNSAKEKEQNAHLLETQLQRQVQQHQGAEAKLAENRSEFLRLQTSLHQLEENYLTSSQSMQEQIAKELREAEKLRQQLMEKELSASEDKYLRNKMAEDCAHLTKENGLLQSQVLAASKQLEQERQLREVETNNSSRRITDLATGKEKARQLELVLSQLKRLVQDERQKVTSAQEQLLHLQQGTKSVEINRQSLHSQLMELENRHSRIHLENSKLRTDKAHLVEHISQLHKQIAERENEILHMNGYIRRLTHDLDNLKSNVNIDDSVQHGRLKEFSTITNSMQQIANTMSHL
ncbi:early endosome antigen 1-like isoform X2 [Ambystoma mexicanum]|uniref:early endosome antigen 1-like isoform X2 n=1 Tax=Ambystoma mexicanum TaxID=8296 RepID=UPI0037E98DF1